MDKETQAAADRRIMEQTTVRLEGRQLKASQGARTLITDLPVWGLRASKRAASAMVVFGD